MTRSGTTTPRPPIGWVFLDRHRNDGYTIRWQRGDPVAYVLAGNQMFSHQTADVLHTITVSPTGWTDLAEIRRLGQAWMRQASSAAPRR